MKIFLQCCQRVLESRQKCDALSPCRPISVTEPPFFSPTPLLVQVQEPQTDRQLIETSPVLQKLTGFEDSIGVLFTHVRLLARAFTLRTVGFNHLTL